VNGPSNFGIAVNFIPPGYTGGLPTHISIPEVPSEGVSMTALLARSNPSRPEVTPFTLIQDLVEIPKMLQGVGKLIKARNLRDLSPKELANHYLSAKFGWIPLSQDLKDVLDLQTHVLKRTDELNRLLNESSGLKRSLKLGNWNAESVQKNVSVSSDIALQCDVTRSRYTHIERWGTVRWKPYVVPTHRVTDVELNQMARRICSGMTTQATMEGLWDVIPWTWMINWFTNVRDFATQFSNAVPSYSQDACVMTRTYTTEINIVSNMSAGYTGGGGARISERKERYVGSATLEAHLPFISVDRLKVLGALAVQRFLR
jgi:hypothetical protein